MKNTTVWNVLDSPKEKNVCQIFNFVFFSFFSTFDFSEVFDGLESSVYHPNGIFSNQKSQFGKILESLVMEASPLRANFAPGGHILPLVRN
jgi:hypothetical protein